MATQGEILELWKNTEVEEYEITDELADALRENLYVQLLYFDISSFLLMRGTRDSEWHDFEELCGIMSKMLPNEKRDDIISETSRSIDTLLDAGILRPRWVKTNGTWKRMFSNRGETVEELKTFEKKLDIKCGHEGFLGEIKELRQTLFNEKERQDWDKRKKETEASLKEFIEKVTERAIKEKNCDMIIPLMRKGKALLEYFKEEEIVSLRDLEIGDIVSLRLGKYKNRIPLILDDAIDEGNTVLETVDDIEDGHKKVRDYAVTAYTINCRHVRSDALARISFLDLVRKQEEETEFYRDVRNILMYIISSGLIIDPDHLHIKGELCPPADPRQIMNVLNDLGLGEIIEPDLDHLHPNTKKITIDKIADHPHKERLWSDFPQVKGFDVSKIRLLFSRKKSSRIGKEYKIGEFEVVPVLDPVVSVEHDKCCNPEFKICNMTGSSLDEYEVDPPPCVDCIICNMVQSLAMHFLKEFSTKLKDYGVEISSLVARYDYMHSKYDEFESEIFSKFTKELNDYLNLS